ncbi:hypothetical protein ACGF5M_00690 [Gemmatimonadota bacterium]
MLWLKILGGIAALVFGLWLGSAGAYRHRPEEIDQAMERGGRRRYQVRRRFVAVDYLMRKRRVSQRRAQSGSRRMFDLVDSRPPAPKKPPPPPKPR